MILVFPVIIPNILTFNLRYYHQKPDLISESNFKKNKRINIRQVSNEFTLHFSMPSEQFFHACIIFKITKFYNIRVNQTVQYKLQFVFEIMI